MIRKSRHFADVGAIALATSILVSGILLPASAQAAPTAIVTAPAASQASAVTRYVALGDSYAAGQGAGAYENACLQSPYSYPEALNAAPQIELKVDASCSGATTTSVLTRQLPAVVKTVKSRDIGLVTVTVGANDLGLVAVTAYCSVSFVSPECQAALNKAYALMTPLSSRIPSKLALRLSATFAGVALVAPRAKILVTGYPYLFETPPPTDPNYVAITQLNTATATLNATIQGAVAQLAQARVNIHYVDVTGSFAGHGIGSPVPWINFVGPDAFHPTAAGYRAYADALTARL